MSNNLDCWTSDPEFNNLLNFLIERTKEVKAPLSITQLAGEFKETSKSSLTTSGLRHRIQLFRPIIHLMEHIGMDTKVKLLFALSVPIDNVLLKKLKVQADIVLDDHHRIVKYRKHSGKLELDGVHGHDISETIKRDKRMIEFLAQKAAIINHPITNYSFVRDFKQSTGFTGTDNHLVTRYKLIQSKIHDSADYDQKTKVRMLFVSGASVPNGFLETLRKDALVEVDEKNRIIKYRANDGNSKLQGDHSLSAKIKIRQNEKSRSYCKQITNYFENQNENNEEMSNLIKFITVKCENVGSPFNCWRLAKEYQNVSRTSKSLTTSYERIKAYGREIQKLGVLDTATEVKQLFGLGAPLNIDFLEKLRKKAVVEVDHKNQILHYISNDGSLTLKGYHWGSRPAESVEAMTGGNDKESDEEGLDDDSVEFLKLEFDSKFDSEDESHLNETEEAEVERATGTEENNDFSVRQELMPERADTTVYGGTMGNENEKMAEKIAPAKTRYGRLLKRSHLDSEFSYELTDSKTNAEYSKSAKKKKTRTTSQMPDLVDSMILEESNDIQVKLEPFRGSLIDGYAPLNPEDDIEVIPKFCEPKKEIEEEFPIKTEDDCIIPKQEILEEEEDFKQEFSVPGDDIKGIPSSELCEFKKEVEEEAPRDIELMERPIKIEENFIIPKLDEGEEDSLPK